MSKCCIIAVALTLAGIASSARAQAPVVPTRSVTLTLAEYNRLLDLSSRPPVRDGVAPVGAALSTADLSVRVDRDVALGTFTMTGEVLREGPTRLTLVPGGTLVNGSLNGRPLPLVVDGEGHAAILQGVGPFTLNVDWGAPVTFRPGQASFTLPVPTSGMARATIDVPGEQADVRLSAGVVTRRTVASGRTVVEATLRPGAATDVSWTMRDSAPVAATREARIVSDVLMLVTLADSEVRMAALVDITVLQGEPRTVSVHIPEGYEVGAVTGSSVEDSEVLDGTVVLTMNNPSLRSHQVLITLDRAHPAGSFQIATGIVTVPAAERDRGEIAVEGVGTLDLDSPVREELQRIDARELNPALQSLARTPILMGFRYRRGPNPVLLALDVRRFGDAGVLAAIAEHAVATTMVTSEGRAITEVMLQVRNRAQPFAKLTLPAGATLASVEVAGEPAKPVLGADGVRIPLLRAGFRPTSSYTVSYVYMHGGAPLERKGELSMSLPRMDLPVAMLDWEVFVPERYAAKVSGGNLISRPLQNESRVARNRSVLIDRDGPEALSVLPRTAGLPGQIKGRAVDATGAVLPGVTVDLEVGGAHWSAVSGGDGAYVITGVPGSGVATLTATLLGFNSRAVTFWFDQRPLQWNPELKVGALEEAITVSVAGSSPVVDVAQDRLPPSMNVVNLQRRAAGVLPIRIDVPRAGSSHQFIKPLVIDQETSVTFRYKRR